jgi:ABC-2 type transport system permease protein
MYPYAMIEERFGTGTIHAIYMANPVAEAVLLIQRGFWWPATNEDLAANFPDDLWARGFIMLGCCLVLLAFAQWVFTRLEGRVPELLT